jgi:hypothetical protein
MAESANESWTGGEIDLIVADYFAMLSLELSGAQYVKAYHNAALQKLTGRTRGSIERKHQNISAVLVRLGLPWIEGYKPLTNFQNALISGVERHLERGSALPLIDANDPTLKVFESRQLWIGPPPALRKEEDEAEPVCLTRLIKKFDPALRDARNRSLGRQGEQMVVEHERQSLASIGRYDLVSKVRWVSEEDGDGAGYDIMSFDSAGRERLLEVKTTIGHATTPFFMSESERALSVERKDAFRLMRVYDFARRPAAFELPPPLTDWVALRATNYRAEFG